MWSGSKKNVVYFHWCSCLWVSVACSLFALKILFSFGGLQMWSKIEDSLFWVFSCCQTFCQTRSCRCTWGRRTTLEAPTDPAMTSSVSSLIRQNDSTWDMFYCHRLKLETDNWADKLWWWNWHKVCAFPWKEELCVRGDSHRRHRARVSGGFAWKRCEMIHVVAVQRSGG